MWRGAMGAEEPFCEGILLYDWVGIIMYVWLPGPGSRRKAEVEVHVYVGKRKRE
jgi:hypothetical protein